ncbi:hypothetical protein B0H19DRAFT_245354 [Mycena capillaripes]|nr:hypothetical protein B0H19DRAFT_245354 [Mycena capillaripes]
MDPFYEIPLRRDNLLLISGTVVYHPFLYLLFLVKSYLHAWSMLNPTVDILLSFFHGGRFLCFLPVARIILPVDLPEGALPPSLDEVERNNGYLLATALM